MRICYLCPDLGIPLDGHKGASAHVRSLIAAFRAQGHTVTLISPTVSPETAAATGAIAAPEPELFSGLAAGTPKRVARALRHLWANAGVEQALQSAIGSAPPDLIYERYSPFAIAGGIYARARGIPHVLEVNAPLAREGAAYRQQALGEAALALERSAFETTDVIVAVSAELREELVAGGVAAEKIIVVPNGVDTAMFRASGEPAASRQPDRPVTFGFVGSLKPWHGIAHMVAAFRAVADRTRCRLLVIGDGPEAARIDALREERPDEVERIGAVPHREIPGYLQATDIALAPYPALERFYYSPLKILEYMAAGRAIVASDVGQVSELIEDGRTGILVPPGDGAALAEAMHALARDETMRMRLGAEAADVARRQHDWSDRASRILAHVGNRVN